MSYDFFAIIGYQRTSDPVIRYHFLKGMIDLVNNVREETALADLSGYFMKLINFSKPLINPRAKLYQVIFEIT